MLDLSSPRNRASPAIVGSRSRRMPSSRACVADRSCSAAIAVMLAWIVNDSRTRMLTRPASSLSMPPILVDFSSRRQLYLFAIPTSVKLTKREIMHAALVTEFGQPPHYATIDPPVPADGEVLVDVLAAGLHPRVRSGAAGAHYASSKVLPLVPGVDGVGRTPDGQRVYFLTLDTAHGSMAEQTLARPGRVLPLPDGADDVIIAAGINPAMSSWVPLRHRVHLQPGQGVLVLGATGIAGRMAVQIARHFGASRVVGLGRDPVRLAALTSLGAAAVLPL